jgi:hypothetical protein
MRSQDEVDLMAAAQRNAPTSAGVQRATDLTDLITALEGVAASLNEAIQRNDESFERYNGPEDTKAGPASPPPSPGLIGLARHRVSFLQMLADSLVNQSSRLSSII